MLEGTVGAQRETAAKFREKGKSGGQFGLRWGRKSGTKSFEGGVNRFGRLEKFLPLRCRKFLHSFVAKLKKQRLRFYFCAWFFGTAVGCCEYFLKSEVPFRGTLQNKRAGARKFKRKGNKGAAYTAGGEMTGEPNKRRKSKKCRLHRWYTAAGTGESGGE